MDLKELFPQRERKTLVALNRNQNEGRGEVELKEKSLC